MSGASGPEKRVVVAIAKALEARGAICVKTHGSAYSGAGEPDLLGCLPGGRCIALEAKRPGGGEMTMLQRRRLWAYAERGAAAGEVRSVAEALAICFRD